MNAYRNDIPCQNRSPRNPRQMITCTRQCIVHGPGGGVPCRARGSIVLISSLALHFQRMRPKVGSTLLLGVEFVNARLLLSGRLDVVSWGSSLGSNRPLIDFEITLMITQLRTLFRSFFFHQARLRVAAEVVHRPLRRSAPSSVLRQVALAALSRSRCARSRRLHLHNSPPLLDQEA